LIEKYKATGCLALSLLNDQNIVSGCEGDVPAAVSMIVARHFSNKPVFMANPARVKNDEALFAHCTVPCSLLNDFELKSHFESNLGLAIAGHFNEGKATLFKISSDAEHFAVFSGIIKPCNHQDNLCRTQVRFIAEGLEKYLLEKPLGNHQILVSGDYSKQLEKYCVISGLNKVN
jgi:L-fucose isomerase-like protein